MWCCLYLSNTFPNLESCVLNKQYTGEEISGSSTLDKHIILIVIKEDLISVAIEVFKKLCGNVRPVLCVFAVEWTKVYGQL